MLPDVLVWQVWKIFCLQYVLVSQFNINPVLIKLWRLLYVAPLQVIWGRAWTFSVCNSYNIKWSRRNTNVPRICCWFLVIISCYLECKLPYTWQVTSCTMVMAILKCISWTYSIYNSLSSSYFWYHFLH